MGKFLESEKQRQAQFKARSPYFSDAAREDGSYNGIPRPFCLPNQYAEENLFSEIRQPILDYFAAHEIKWHRGHRPTNHLCSSQICCANFLFPFADKPEALVELLRPLFPTIRRVCSMEQKEPRPLVSFEWIGLQNYLREKVAGKRRRTRGALFTSPDAAVMFEHEGGARQIVLIEWKYAESYNSTYYGGGSQGRTRIGIYRPFFEADDSPLEKSQLPRFENLFYEPFYQLLRQQLLANEMEKAQELGAQTVTLLHIAPARNVDFHKVTSKELQPLGNSPVDIWKRLVRKPDRFISISTEDMFGSFPAREFSELKEWWKYITARYSWVQQGGDGA